MSINVRMPEDLIRILSAGGSLRLSAMARPTDDLIRIAAAAIGGGAHLTLAGMSTRPTEDLVRIASAGRGHVTFED